MAINFETALGMHPQALVLREKRGEVLAANLANADTPGYKARDMDFQSVLKGAMSSDLKLETTHQAHIAPTQSYLEGNLLYRNPNQASLDGNTVEAHVEQAKYAENSVQYQASLRFINGRFNDLKTAIKGGSQ
jgi:flagellar basal-body rod protein FlgB